MNNSSYIVDSKTRGTTNSFYSQNKSFDQLGMLGMCETTLFSMNISSWEINFPHQMITITDLADDNKTTLQFKEFLNEVKDSDAQKLKNVVLSDKKQERQKIDIDVRIKKDGMFKWHKVKGKVFQLPGGELFAAGIVYDIDQSKSMIKRLKYLENHDYLTGFKNFRTFDAIFKKALENGVYPIALVIANIDNLKEINDSLGYHAGNMLIKNVANVIKECFIDAESIVRVAGGEYCAILSGKSSLEIENKINEASMKFHNMYRNLINTEVTFGYVISSQEQEFACLYNQAVSRMQKNKNIKKILSTDSVVDRLNGIISRKTGWEKRSVRLQNLAMKTGYKLGCTEDCLNEIMILTKIADIGLIGIDDRLLANRTNLGGKDKLEYMKHIDIGRAVIESIDELCDIKGLYLDIYKRYDEWEEGIALSSRIIACAMGLDDIIFVYDSLPLDRINEWLLEQKGTKYCPSVVDAIIEVVSQQM
ncbi:MAG: diguanylate cyclase domain-containing protein [Christensenellales bacterium]